MNFAPFLEIFSYTFMQRALVVGVLVSVCAALLGVVLVLKHYSLIGHGLADIGFAAVSLALVLGFSPTLVATPIVIVSAFVIMYISEKKKTGDAAIAIFSTSALAVGIIITSFGQGFTADVYGYMFGSILAMTRLDVVLSLGLSALVLILFIVFYNRIFLVTMDEQFALATGINVRFYQFLIAFLTALTVVLGMRIMGTLLISSLIIFPAIIARRLAQSFKGVALVSAIISVICFVLGLALSFFCNIPTGAAIVLTNLAVLLLVHLFQLFPIRVS